MTTDTEYLEELRALFTQQAEHTAPLRRFLYRKAGLLKRASVLDVGCGTGDVTAELKEMGRGSVKGVDSNPDFIEYAAGLHPGVDFEVADCTELPFDDSSFDLVTFHFMLMWVGEPRQAVVEMVRVLRGDGVLLACAEPDYGGLVEYPRHPEFWSGVVGALRKKGADPESGRKLSSLMRTAGLGVEAGVSATPWEGEHLREQFENRYRRYGRDLESVLGAGAAEGVLEEERRQVEAGKMVMVPLFWALGRKPGPS